MIIFLFALVSANSLSSYIYSELTRGYWLEHNEAKYSEKRDRVYIFMKIPRELEKVMLLQHLPMLFLPITLFDVLFYVLKFTSNNIKISPIIVHKICKR